jgi:hypothetical protein
LCFVNILAAILSGSETSETRWRGRSCPMHTQGVPSPIERLAPHDGRGCQQTIPVNRRSRRIRK